jgi:hypothetical protein
MSLMVTLSEYRKCERDNFPYRSTDRKPTSKSRYLCILYLSREIIPS